MDEDLRALLIDLADALDAIVVALQAGQPHTASGAAAGEAVRRVNRLRRSLLAAASRTSPVRLT